MKAKAALVVLILSGTVLFLRPGVFRVVVEPWLLKRERETFRFWEELSWTGPTSSASGELEYTRWRGGSHQRHGKLRLVVRGRLRVVGEYRYGKVHGSWVYYGANGRVLKTYDYRDGVRRRSHSADSGSTPRRVRLLWDITPEEFVELDHRTISAPVPRGCGGG